jgi:hypothetical protein
MKFDITTIINGAIASSIGAFLSFLLSKLWEKLNKLTYFFACLFLVFFFGLIYFLNFKEEINIVYPLSGVEVRPNDLGFFPVNGIWKNLDANKILWLLIQYPEEEKIVYPGFGKIINKNKEFWTENVCLGKGPKRLINIVVVSVKSPFIFEDYAKEADKLKFSGISMEKIKSIDGYHEEARVNGVSVSETIGCKRTINDN